ncbi:50S ribosomal protein L11 methyltransferase [Alterisphingorhabdus coralli]|uniref:Ribosomal protein L11 methyltransferase n=1 Tax=Alterisphingorhabdus coralli TaxID=3071408 RepID=A0AA97FBB5_9SPHN|nr:50S ribosomal protein L11 methyltransferase [Parasphingorhabdus sp. SCSIO 66989]WOE76497.1 50S ribosomal protein L11 methyltransferase [Parasphingorhabdus sp. SCSIO 66989]
MMSNSWKITLPCTRAEAEALDMEDFLPGAQDIAPTLVTRRADGDDDTQWLIEIYCDDKPDKAMLKQVATLVPKSDGEPELEELPEEDWVTVSQQGLEPIRAGRFHVHTPDHASSSEPGVYNIRIGAGQAFGTGHHETTAGCLAMLDHIRRSGARADTILDLGSGTGLLAFAAEHLWPRAYITATDIDPVSVEVMGENIIANGLKSGMRQGEIAAIAADGMDDLLIQARAPYQLIVANILAAPLIALSEDIAAGLSPQGNLVLAGLMNHQAEDVLRAYRRQGLRLAHKIVDGEWSILWLRKRPVV